MIIPILTYHEISKERIKNRYTLDEKEFSSQIKFLSESGFSSLLADEYCNALKDPSPDIPEKSVMITFDDGHESDYTIVLPLLKKYRLKANFFITTDWIDTKGYMTSSQLRALRAEGMSIQSHTKSHRFLDELSEVDIHFELEESKKKLEDILGGEVSFLAFPGGRYGQRVIDSGKELKFSGLFSSVPFSLKRYDDLFLIGRYGMKQASDGPEYFKNIIFSNLFKRSLLTGSYYGKFWIKKMIGNHLYHLAWKKYIGKS